MNIIMRNIMEKTIAGWIFTVLILLRSFDILKIVIKKRAMMMGTIPWKWVHIEDGFSGVMKLAMKTAVHSRNTIALKTGEPLNILRSASN